MKECDKKSPLRCLNCNKDCDMKKITKIFNDLGLLKEYVPNILNSKSE